MIKFPSSPPRTGPLRLPDARPRGSSCRQHCQAGRWGWRGASWGAQRTLPCTSLAPRPPPPSSKGPEPLGPALCRARRSQLQGLAGAPWTPPLSSASGTACQGLLPSGCQQGADVGALWNQDSGHPDQPELGQTQTFSPPSHFPPFGSLIDQGLETARPGSRSCRLAC